MTRTPGLVARNLVYHWRGNLAVLLGVAVGSAVLTGALLVGDSLRGSLRARAERQLNGVEAAAFFPRPIRSDIADDMARDSSERPSPVLMLPGSIQTVTVSRADARYVGGVTVYGVRREPGADAGAVLSHRVAERLGVAAGDKVRVGVERFSDLSRSSSLAERDAENVVAQSEFTVSRVLAPDDPAGEFALTPSPDVPLIVRVPLDMLHDRVRADATVRRVRPRPVGDNPTPPTPRANVLLAARGPVADLNAKLSAALRPEDYGLRFRTANSGPYLRVDAEQLVLPPNLVTAVELAAKDAGLRAEPTVVYIADTLAAGTVELPYPIIAGLNPAAAAPLGPFLPPGVAELKDNEVVLVEWDGLPLNGLTPGTTVSLTYFDPEVEGEGRVRREQLTLRGHVKLTAQGGTDLTPPVPGMTDENSELLGWNRPPMLPRDRVQARVKHGSPRAKFWDQHKAAPMAYVNLATGRRLFGSRYGEVTSVRVAPAANESPDQTAERLRLHLKKHLDPATAGLTFQPVRERLLGASRGGTDFGGLFLGFSFFLIAAALMLVGLLFRLTLDRRAKEVGLLLASGYRVRTVRRLLLAEGLFLAVIGAGLGLVAAVGYNRLLLNVLLELWPDRTVAGFLKPHATPGSFVSGFTLTVLMAVGAVWLSVRGLVRVPVPALLRGETTVEGAGHDDRPGRRRRSRIFNIAALVSGVALIVGGVYVSNPDYRAMTFFGGGALLLTAGLTAVWVRMKQTRRAPIHGHGLAALGRLGGRNAARNPARSLLTAALLASAAFLLVAVESFRRQTGPEFAHRDGGSGGFNLIAEAGVPVFQPFDQTSGRDELEDSIVRAYRDAADPKQGKAAVAELAALNPEADGTPNVIPLRLRAGDDASCLNLYQATRPRVLGVPDALVNRGGFKFYASEAATPEERANPWLLLRKPLPNGVVPVVVENNTAVWMLKTSVGGEIRVPDDTGREVTCRIVGTLADSPFQSEVLMADADFTRLYPADAGYRAFLIHTSPDKEDAVARVVGLALRANGLVVTPTRDRVATYQAVIGAYLSTFQLLGGLGLLLGVLGLAVVLLRGVWERVGELALLRAVGYRPRALQFLVLAENAVLLLVGLGVGVVAGLASVAPHVADGATVPWHRLAVMLGAVLAVGLVVAAVATAGILRVPVVPALRRE